MAKRGQETLAQVPLFTHLSSRHLKRLADLAAEHRYMQGARIVKEGDQGDSFFVIVQGQAKVTDAAGKVVNRLLPGDFFGEISLLDGGARTATVSSETPLTTLVLTRSAFRKVIQEEPTVAIKLLEYVAIMLRRLERPLSG